MPEIVSRGSRGGFPTPLPNVNTLMGARYGGGGVGGLLSSAVPWKKRLQGGAPLPGTGGGPTGEPGGGATTPVGPSIGRPLTPKEGMLPLPGLRQGRGGGLPNLDPNFNIYEDYPGFKPQQWHGDSLMGLDRMRGAGPEQLRQLSDASIRLQGYSRPSRSTGGAGFGFSNPDDAFRRLLQARLGGSI